MRALLAALLLALLPTLSSATVTFVRRWHWFTQDIGHSVTLAQDGGYAASTETWIESNRYGVVLAKTDSLGDTSWVCRIRDVDRDGGYACRLLDGGYAVLGTSNGRTIFVRKFSAAGDSLWTYTSSWRGPVSAIIATADTGCAIAGRFPDTLFDFGLIKLRGDGTEEWARHYHEPAVFQSWARNLAQTRDGGFILCGDASDYMDSYLRLARIKPDGDAVWTRLYAGLVGPVFTDVRELPDSGFLAVGYAFDTLNGRDAIYMMRTSPRGDTIRTQTIAPDAAAQAAAMCATRDGGFAVTGFIDWTDSARAWLVKLDGNADTVWTAVLPGSGHEVGADIEQAVDGGYVVAGTSDSAGGSLLLIKTDSLGGVMVGVAEERSMPDASHPKFEALPSPAIQTLNVRLSSGAVPWSLRIYDTRGGLVRSMLGLRDSELRLDLRSMPAGIYLLRLDSDRGSATRKLVIE